LAAAAAPEGAAAIGVGCAEAAGHPAGSAGAGLAAAEPDAAAAAPEPAGLAEAAGAEAAAEGLAATEAAEGFAAVEAAGEGAVLDGAAVPPPQAARPKIVQNVPRRIAPCSRLKSKLPRFSSR